MSNPSWLPDSAALQNAIKYRSSEAWACVHEYRKNLLPAVHAYRNALADDGWDVEPTYSHEATDRAWSARREGFVISGLARCDHGVPIGCPSLRGWCPKGISIEVPAIYSFEAIKAATRHCPECGADNVDTERVAFANRACAKCAPSLREKLETRGWNA